jgi:hypothetical protein
LAKPQTQKHRVLNFSFCLTGAGSKALLSLYNLSSSERPPFKCCGLGQSDTTKMKILQSAGLYTLPAMAATMALATARLAHVSTGLLDATLQLCFLLHLLLARWRWPFIMR